MEQEASDHAQDFKRATQTHAREEQALQCRIDELERENDDLRTHARLLEDRLKAGSLNVGKVMNVLNRHNTRVPAGAILSWRHYGILLKFQPGTAKEDCQTAEFQDYTPNLSKNMDADAVRSVQQMYLEKIVTFMSNNRRAFWMIGHWFVIHHQLDAYSLGLHSERKNEWDKARLLYQALLDEAVIAGLPQSMLK
ncbi:Dual specificity protein kinase shkA [Phytophthora cinnamomi]|uniref:Dual specificity protein kinase shkA n=1 Tax=Phytophthora cinnamomi TaxID=4785 RepID=UPI00355A75AF|nr:Dual specificity protein kinase shkA [Phytophthora cinnamomi]